MAISGISKALLKKAARYGSGRLKKIREPGVGRGKYSSEYRGFRKAGQDQINKRNAITTHLKPLNKTVKLFYLNTGKVKN